MIDPADGALLEIEMYPDNDADPCEVYFSDYHEMDGRMLPGKIEVRHGESIYRYSSASSSSSNPWGRNDRETPAGSRFLSVAWPLAAGAGGACARGRLGGHLAAAESISFAPAIAATQPKMVKIFGAGGQAGLEPYQSGFLISADGHVLTAWSYVLDTDYITATLNDGRKFEAKLIGADPRWKSPWSRSRQPGSTISSSPRARRRDTGARVLAFSNLFGVATGDEPDSVQHGVFRPRPGSTRGAALMPRPIAGRSTCSTR